jgi:hypothetical protein
MLGQGLAAISGEIKDLSPPGVAASGLMPAPPRRYAEPLEKPMKMAIALLALLLAGILMPSGVAPALAGEPAVWSAKAPDQAPPFSRSERAQAIWASGACWSECGAHCTWGIAACLSHDAQGHCLSLGNTCDRYCQRQCRSSGGPLVPDIFDF